MELLKHLAVDFAIDNDGLSLLVLLAIDDGTYDGISEAVDFAIDDDDTSL